MSLFQKIFGGSENSSYNNSVSNSKNQNKGFSFVRQKFAPAAAGNYKGGLNAMTRLLGNNFDDYKENTGFDFVKELGMKNLMGQFGSGGTLQSGAAAKGLQAYGAGLEQTFADRYLAGQQARSNLGLGGGNLLGSTGSQTISKTKSFGSGSGSSNPGISSFIGALLGGGGGGG